MAAGARAFALNAGCWQCCFTTNQLNEFSIQGVQLFSNRVQKISTLDRAQASISWKRAGGSTGRVVDLLWGCLVEGVGQGFARAGIYTLDDDAAVGAALAANKILARDEGHCFLQAECSINSCTGHLKCAVM
ncbi:hypothetical protein PSEUDO8Z_100448 [Pseudomonas sp. 8Z]|nr:hypothetical protein PSEUDO8Z_100448 [Pseudomonas sp. 8Z]